MWQSIRLAERLSSNLRGMDRKTPQRAKGGAWGPLCLEAPDTRGRRARLPPLVPPPWFLAVLQVIGSLEFSKGTGANDQLLFFPLGAQQFAADMLQFFVRTEQGEGRKIHSRLIFRQPTFMPVAGTRVLVSACCIQNMSAAGYSKVV